MADLIDRQAAIRAVKRNAPYRYKHVENAILEDINVIPAVEAEPVRHGKWEQHYIRPGVFKDGFWYCSCCGGKLADDFANHYKYCPDCGARMDEVEQDG